MLTEYDQQHHHQGGYTPYDQRGYQQYEQQQQAQQRPNVLERGRAVRLMRNGDPFFTGRTFVINQRKYPMLDVFLDDASQALRANFGAVRCIYTPKHGTRLRDIQDFEDHCTYVAAGGERFKKLHYLDIAEGKRIATKGQISPKLPPVRRMDVEGRALKLSRSENMIIYVYRNGDPLTLPAKVLLVKSTLPNWESVLDEVTRKVSPSNSAVLKLYALNGELITSAQQLEYNGMYVAAGKERYRRIDYPDPKSLSPSFSPKMSRKSSKHHFSGVYPRLRLPARQRRVDDSNGQHYHQPGLSPVHHRYTKSDGTNTHTTTATSYGSTDHPGQRRPVRGDDYDFFNNKPQQHRRGPTKETDLDRDDGGIYKGRMNHRERPREIDETRDTRVDLPVDYGEAETVDEENLYGGRGGKTPRRAPPPQSFSEPRSRQIKSPQKNHNDDDTRYPPYGHTRNNNGYDNDHHRTPTRPDDDQYEPPLPHTTHRQPLISSSTQTHQDQRQHYQMQHEESNIDRYRESSQMMENDYDNDDDRV